MSFRIGERLIFMPTVDRHSAKEGATAIYCGEGEYKNTITVQWDRTNPFVHGQMDGSYSSENFISIDSDEDINKRCSEIANFLNNVRLLHEEIAEIVNEKTSNTVIQGI